jgi:serine protease inhibitor
MNSRVAFVYLSACWFFTTAIPLFAADSGFAANATNEVGLDLYRKLATGDNNLCLSPYSRARWR